MTNRKIPSQFNDLLSHSIINSGPLFINVLLENCCGRAENRTRNLCVIDSCFAIKLLAHNKDTIALNYLNFLNKLN